MIKFTKTKLILLFILLFSFTTRIVRLSVPQTYIFDEVYHAYTAKAYAKNDPRGYQWWNTADEEGTAFEWLHPPVSKLIMAGSIKIFGENSFAWRLPSALFGTLAIYLVYLLTKNLFEKQNISLLAAAVASLDGLLLVQSRIAMNDIYLVAFMLATLIFYTKYTKSSQNKFIKLTGLFLGLSISTKWSGLFLLPIIGLIEGYKIAIKKTNLNLKHLFKLFLSLIILPITVYLASFTQFFLQGHTINQFIELHNQIFRYQFGLTASHPYQSKAYQWPLLIRPVWYHVDYSSPSKTGNIYALSNPIISWSGLLMFFWLIKKLLTSKKHQKFKILLPIIAYIFDWMPWIISPRIMFYYHYTPAIPFLSIFIAYFFTQNKIIQKKYLPTYLVFCFLVFLLLYPHWTGIPIGKTHQKLIYWLPTWK